MALPAGILTGTVTFGQAVSLVGGEETSMTATITPTHDLVHVATGIQLLAFSEDIKVESGMPGSINLPYTDQTGFVNEAGDAFTGWAYKIVGQFRRGSTVKGFTKNFQLPMGQSTVDLDLIPGGSISLPVTAPVARVTSVAGKTGAITVDDLMDAGLGGGGAVPDEGITEAKLAPDAVTQAKIAPAAVGNAELDSEAVTAPKIAADAVTGVKVASGAIAKSKLASALQSEIDGKLTKTAADSAYATLEAAAGLSEVVDTKLSQPQVDARVQAVGDQNYAPIGSGGSELAAAVRLSQFSWSGTGWMDVEGVEFHIGTGDTPAYVEFNPGLCVVNGTTAANLYIRIIDSDDQAIVPGAFAAAYVAANSQGYSSVQLPVIRGRLPAGRPEHRIVAQIQNLDGQLSYIIPDWLSGAQGVLTAFGA